MQNLTFIYNKTKRFLDLLCCFFLMAFFVFGVLLQQKIVVRIMDVVIVLVFLPDLISILLKRNIYIEDENLYYGTLWFCKTIEISKVLWYSENVENVAIFFCKSNNNICLFYDGKELYFSVKEKDAIKSLLSKHNINYIYKEKKADNLWYVTLVICCVAINQCTFDSGSSVLKKADSICCMVLGCVGLLRFIVDYQEIKSRKKLD